jgi:hypothetical protein
MNGLKRVAASARTRHTDHRHSSNAGLRCRVKKKGTNASRKFLIRPVGSGRMLPHATNYSLRLYGVDIDPTLVKVTLVDGAFYVPWILRAVSGVAL